ncbi:MAG: mechanosensitive ion channel family protein [Gemmatimonadota bacterium]
MSIQQALERFAAIFGIDPGRVLRVVVQIALIWIVGWLVSRGIRLISKRILASVDDGDDFSMTAAEKRGQTIAQLLRSVGRVVIFIAVVSLTLNQFIDIGPILTGFGILSLAVSFGAQSLVKDLIAGFFILFENQFVVGDVIEVGSKSGVVERMTLRIVMLRDAYGSLHIIQNGAISLVSNLTRGWSRAVIEVAVSYVEDVDRVIAVFRDELEQFRRDPEWQQRLDGLPEVAGVEGLTERGVVIRTQIRTRPGAQWDVAREFRRRIKSRLDRERIAIPFVVPSGLAPLRGALPDAALVAGASSPVDRAAAPQLPSPR